MKIGKSYAAVFNPRQQLVSDTNVIQPDLPQSSHNRLKSGDLERSARKQACEVNVRGEAAKQVGYFILVGFPKQSDRLFFRAEPGELSDFKSDIPEGNSSGVNEPKNSPRKNRSRVNQKPRELTQGGSVAQMPRRGERSEGEHDE